MHSSVVGDSCLIVSSCEGATFLRYRDLFGFAIFGLDALDAVRVRDGFGLLRLLGSEADFLELASIVAYVESPGDIKNVAFFQGFNHHNLF